MKLLSNATSNAKTKKLLKTFGYEAAILYMAPADIADNKHTVCPYSTPGCRESCLFTAGRGNTPKVYDARVAKTLLFLNQKESFCWNLMRELHQLKERARKKRCQAVCRLNGTSDIAWEQLIGLDEKIQFYDYTKNLGRMTDYLAGKLRDNYHLTYSYHEYVKDSELQFIIHNKGNVAVVFKDKIPKKWKGYEVINGDEHDFRFRDPKGKIVGLTAKGRAKKDTTGFVVEGDSDD